jgi:hypothetical protein
MERIIVPTARKIPTMSWERCQYMRIRLENEISFARGDQAITDGSNAEAVAENNRAIEMIRERLRALARIGAGSQSSQGSDRLSRYSVIATKPYAGRVSGRVGGI